MELTLDDTACQTVTSRAMASVTALPESAFDRRKHPDMLGFSEWRAADGWPHRVYRWPAAGAERSRGSLLFQSGRGDFIEKYLEACDHWWRGGWAVEGFGWRGQGGSGRVQRGVDIDHRDSFDPLVDDLAAYVAEWRARTPAPHVIVAHSMGGHVALRLCAERGVTLDALVLVAPMLGINVKPLPMWLARVMVSGLTAIGLGRRVARQERPDNPRRQRRLTADYERYADSQWWKEANPGLGLGPPTWGWIGAALASAARFGRLETVETPVLLLVAGRDQLVDGRAIAAAATRLPIAELKRFPNAAHELLREADADRVPALATIDAFLNRVAPAR